MISSSISHNSSSLKIGYSIGSILKIKDALYFSSEIYKKENTHSIWTPESWGKEAFSMLGAISQVTKKVKLGTSIINIYSRTPATIAMGAISIDNISDNGIIVGLGASTPAIVENLHGIRFHQPIQRMKEYIESLRLLFNSKEKINYEGKIVKIKDFAILEKSKSYIPIYIAAVNKKMIQLGLEYADGLLLYLRPYNEIKSLMDQINKNNKLNFCKSLVLITSISNKKPQKAKERVAKTLAFYLSVGKVYYNFLSGIEEYKAEVEEIFKEYHNHGLQRATERVTSKMLDDLVVYGSVNDCKNQIKRFVKTGIDLPILQINPIIDDMGELDYKDFLEL
jgi:alkanesulfonate monooxygenase SsuD/methylene tetrahydromethanopterin reductase-like flavin-dependent oxidoreductase (luciferase family)